jgi:predicted metal-dependent peptidase
MSEDRAKDKQAQELIKYGRLAALSNKNGYGWPYCSRAAYAVNVIESKGVPTMGVSENWILYYNPDFVKELTLKQLSFTWLHEILHLLMDHAGRAKRLGVTEKTHERWNVAADIAINYMLRSAGLEAKEGYMTAEMFGLEEGLSPEEYYHLLADDAHLKMMEELSELLSGSCCSSGADGIKKPWEQSSKEFEEKYPGIGKALGDAIRKEVANEASKMPGKLPQGFQLWVDAFLKPSKVPWNKELRSSAVNFFRSKRGLFNPTFKRPNRRQNGNPILMPSYEIYDPNICSVLDTSGSMSDKDYESALIEMQSIFKQLNLSELRVIACDADAHKDFYAKDIRTVKQNIYGGGGTDMGAGIEKAMSARKKPDLIIVLTDGYTPWPEVPPKAKVIIVLTRKVGESEYSRTPSWAKTIQVDNG